jgi:hypothetical protein
MAGAYGGGAQPKPKILSLLAIARAICKATAGEPSDSELVLDRGASIDPHGSCGTDRHKSAARTNTALIAAYYSLPIL